MVQRLVANERHVGIVGDQRLAYVMRERRVPPNQRNALAAATFVRHVIDVVHAQAECGIVIEKEGGYVIVADQEAHVLRASA